MNNATALIEVKSGSDDLLVNEVQEIVFIIFAVTAPSSIDSIVNGNMRVV